MKKYFEKKVEVFKFKELDLPARERVLADQAKFLGQEFYEDAESFGHQLLVDAGWNVKLQDMEFRFYGNDYGMDFKGSKDGRTFSTYDDYCRNIQN